MVRNWCHNKITQFTIEPISLVGSFSIFGNGQLETTDEQNMDM